MAQSDDALNLLGDLIARARRSGADAADAVLINSASLSVSYRLGKPERVERSESGDIGLRVLIGKQQAIVSSSDRESKALDDLVERAAAMARAVPEDPYCGLADASELSVSPPALDICDPDEPAPEQLIDWAQRTEEAARSVPGGDEFGRSRSWLGTFPDRCGGGRMVFANSYWVSNAQISASVLAGNTRFWHGA